MNSIHDVYTPIRVLVPQTFKYELEETYEILSKKVHISQKKKHTVGFFREP
jgi:hypothetical protein